MRRGSSGVSCLIAIDKPYGPTSHDVVARVRRALGERRVGHAGTLDPQATGVLVVGVGPATRLLGMLSLDVKSYDARISFGSETTTDDAEGEVTRTCAVPQTLRDAAVARALLQQGLGEHDQVPPAFSAISQGGERAYAKARRGELVELPARRVTVFAANLEGLGESADGELFWDCSFTVSKGTYVRALARDLGRAGGCAAHLVALRRAAAGAVTLADCVRLDEVVSEGNEGIRESALDPVRALGLAVREVSEAEERDVTFGRPIAAGMVTVRGHACEGCGERRPPEAGEQVALVRGSRLLGVWELCEGRLRSVRTFPGGVWGCGHER